MYKFFLHVYILEKLTTPLGGHVFTVQIHYSFFVEGHPVVTSTKLFLNSDHLFQRRRFLKFALPR